MEEELKQEVKEEEQKKEQSNIEKLIKNKWAMTAIIISIIIALIVIFSSGIFSNNEYDVYKYAIECVREDLYYPDTATYPSFNDSTIKKSDYTTELIISGKNFEKAWDVSGSGTCENRLGMTINYRFTVTVVLDEYGKFWCYKCSVT